MFAIGKTLVSIDLLEKYFVCDINKCKGECCVKGDAGAPLLDHEIEVLETIAEFIFPYMDRPGREKVQADGVFEIDRDGDRGTTLLDNGRCAFAIKGSDSIYSCSIEKAHVDGKIDMRKPQSCFLYPVRITKYPNYDAVNYDKWDICKEACTLGNDLKMPLYRFVKDALINRYGTEWYSELETIDELRKRESRV